MNERQMDVLNKMEKRRLIQTVEAWLMMRRIRNGLMHEYPDNPAVRVEVLNRAIELVPDMVKAVNDTRDYVQRHIGLDLTAFPPLEEKGPR